MDRAKIVDCSSFKRDVFRPEFAKGPKNRKMCIVERLKKGNHAYTADPR